MRTEPRAQVGDVALFEEDDPAGVGEHRGDVRGEQVLALAEAHDEGHVVARPDEPVGLAPVEHGDGIGAVGLAQGGPHGIGDVARVGLLHEVREHLGVGLGAEAVAAREEAVPELPEVLDDAVVDDRHVAGAVDVGMRVEVVGPAVGRPAGVGEADRRLRAWRPAAPCAGWTSLPARFSTNSSPDRRSRARCPPSRSPGTRGARGPRAGWAPRHAARCIRRCRTCAQGPP